MSQTSLLPEPDFDPMADARRIITAAIAEHDPSHIFAMFSGGNDSVCAAHVLASHGPFTAAVHIHTGIGIRETRRHAYEMAQRFGWPFRVYRPRAGDRYQRWVLQHGFPGPFGHRFAYIRLKERSIRRLLRDHNDGGRKVLLVTGVREQESRRRMGAIDEIAVEGRRVWVAPIVHWSGADKERYMIEHGIPGNPVTAKLCMSGECLCGAFASPGELEEIRFWYPKVAQEIDRLAEKCRAAGVHAKWGTRPPPKPDERQALLDLDEPCPDLDGETLRETLAAVDEFYGSDEPPPTGGLCWSCDAKFGNREGDPPLEITVRDPEAA